MSHDDKSSENSALQRAIRICRGDVTYTGDEKLLAKALIAMHERAEQTPRPSLAAPGPVTQDGPLGGYTVIGQAANELDLKLTMLQMEFEAIAELDPHNSAEQDDHNHHFDQIQQLRREILERYTPRSPLAAPQDERLIALAAEVVNENERLRAALGSLLNDKGSVQYPAQHERVVAARKALEVQAVPLSDITNEMRQAAWARFTSADVPYSAIYAVMDKARLSHTVACPLGHSDPAICSAGTCDKCVAQRSHTEPSVAVSRALLLSMGTDHVVRGGPGPLFDAGWAAACETWSKKLLNEGRVSAIEPFVYVAFFEAWEAQRKLPWHKDGRNEAEREAAEDAVDRAWEAVMAHRGAPTDGTANRP